jgi:uncharacterized membrane protein HdeD (DUF308 family)
MREMTFDEKEFVDGATRFWWLFLITGIAWLWVALILLRLNLTTVYAISIMFGIVAIAAGVNEFIAMPVSTRGWKWIRGILGVVFIAAGIVAFFRPEGTFVALASIFAWFVLFKGIFDVTLALVVRRDLWWGLLIVGILEILLGFWAAGYFKGSAVLLVAWIAAFALFRGITELIVGFKLHGLKKAAAAY